jgi:hypothetical protein
MKKVVNNYIVLIISMVGSFASIVALGVCFCPLLNNQGWIGVLFLDLISLCFLVYNFYLILKSRSKVEYVEVFRDINIGFSNLHSINRKKNYVDFYASKVQKKICLTRRQMCKF